MDVFEGSFNFPEKLRLALIRLPASLANVKMVNLAVKNILEPLAHGGKGELLDDVEPFEGLDVAIDAGAIDTSHVRIHEEMNTLQGDLLRFVIQDELEKQTPGGRDPHVVGSQVRKQVLVFFHGVAQSFTTIP